VATNILHVDSDPSARTLVRQAVARMGGHADVIAVDTIRTALVVLAGTGVACIVTELVLGDASGYGVVQRLSSERPGVPIVVLASVRPDDQPAILRTLGVVACLGKETSPEALLSSAIREALGRLILAEAVVPGAVADGPEVSRFGGSDFIAGTVAMRRVLQQVDCVAESSVPVLIEGETGTGKEILARALHVRSARRNAPFITQNCGAVADTLLESELFGHVRGAFTGAERDRPGLFLEAGGGTVFLDEVGEAPPAVQAKLLRVLQHGEVKPLGSDRVQRVSARIVAATNRALESEVRAGRFRADLYYRLAVLPVSVPPLRERAADVPRLVDHFLARFQREERKEGIAISREALGVLALYPWPGNVRELEHEVHRIVLTLDSHSRVVTNHLAPRLRRHTPHALEPLAPLLACVELALIRERLDRFPTKADAARSLGITREALYLKLRRLGACPTETAVGSDLARGDG
jgi:DNA-binding NtrC family response regulator